MGNDFESKLDEITQHFTTELRKVKSELKSAKETSHLNTIHFNGQMKNVSSYFDTALKKGQTELKESKETLRLKTDEFDEELKIVKSELQSSKEILERKTDHYEEEIEKLKIDVKSSKETLQLQNVRFNGDLGKVKTELRSSKTSLDRLQRENAWLKDNLENASKNQDNLMTKIANLDQSSSREFKRMKTELETSKKSFQLKNDDLNEQIENVKTESQSSQASLIQLQRENVFLKKRFETTSENLGNVSYQIQTLARSSSKEPIFFDYTLEHHMTSTGYEIVKFDRLMAVSATKIYDRSTGKVTIKEEGLYYFYAHGLPLEKSGVFYLNIYVDDEAACRAWKNDGTDAHMSCAIVRHFKRGQTIYVKKSNKLYGTYLNGGRSYPHTGFLGFKLQ